MHTPTDVHPIFTEITSMEGLAYDWIGKNIYWTDNIRNSLEVVRYNGQHRKVLNDDMFDRPQGIAVDPKRGWVLRIKLLLITCCVEFSLEKNFAKPSYLERIFTNNCSKDRHILCAIFYTGQTFNFFANESRWQN